MNKIKTNSRLLCDGMKGQNYWLHGSMEYLMECLGESKDYDYWFFSGVSGDSFTQVYRKDINRGLICYTHNCFNSDIAKKMFDACGYEFEYVDNVSNENRNFYMKQIKEYIDQSIPVLCRGGKGKCEFCIIYGYEDDNLYYLICDDTEPRILPNDFNELIFVGDKKERPTIAEAYRKAVMNIPSLIQMPANDSFSFGKQAFIDWADSFQNGTFDDVDIDKINVWNIHGVYLMISGTNGCSRGFLQKALELNPDMSFINTLEPIYAKQGEVFETLAYRDVNGKNDYQNGGLQGGFKIKADVIKKKEIMKSISDKIRESAQYCDDILEVFQRQLIHK